MHNQEEMLETFEYSVDNQEFVVSRALKTFFKTVYRLTKKYIYIQSAMGGCVFLKEIATALQYKVKFRDKMYVKKNS